MTLGVSPTARMLKPLTSTPSISPESMWKTRTGVQRSTSAPRESEIVHGYGTSQGQFSK
jgi:hypothetical protein